MFMCPRQVCILTWTTKPIYHHSPLPIIFKGILQIDSKIKKQDEKPDLLPMFHPHPTQRVGREPRVAKRINLLVSFFGIILGMYNLAHTFTSQSSRLKQG